MKENAIQGLAKEMTGPSTEVESGGHDVSVHTAAWATSIAAEKGKSQDRPSLHTLMEEAEGSGALAIKNWRASFIASSKLIAGIRQSQ